MVEQKLTGNFSNALIAVAALLGLAASGCDIGPATSPAQEAPFEASGDCQMGIVVFPNGNTECLPLERRPVTLVMYFAADSDLEPMLMQDVREAEAAAVPGDAHIIVLIDRAEGYDTADGDWTGAKLLVLANDSDPESIGSPRASAPPLGLTAESQNGEELDMGSPETLSRILDFASEAFPSDELVLHVNGHGGGWGPTGEDIFSGSTDGFRAFGLDRSSGNYLDIVDDFPTALEGRGVDALTFEACGMGNVETVFAVWPHVDFVGASSMPIPQRGFNYTTLLNEWQGRISAQGWLSATTAAFEGSFDSSDKVSWGVYDTTGDRDLFAADIDRFAGELKTLGPQLFRALRDVTPQPNWQQRGMRDLAALAGILEAAVPNKSAESLLQTLEEMEVSSYRSPNLPFVKHLFVYLPGKTPDQGGPYNPDYERTDFAKETGWDELIREYYSTRDLKNFRRAFEPAPPPAPSPGARTACALLLGARW